MAREGASRPLKTEAPKERSAKYALKKINSKKLLKIRVLFP